MANKRLAIMHGIAVGADRAASNLFAINQAKQKLAMEEERFGLDKKVKNAQLKKMEFEQGPEAVAHLTAMMKLEETAKKTQIEKNKLAITGEEQKQKLALKEAQQAERLFNNFFGAEDISPERGYMEAQTGLDYDAGDMGLATPRPSKQPTPKSIRRGGITWDIPKQFDTGMTNQVYEKLIDPAKSNEDFAADLDDLKKNRKTYEDMGVDVVSLLKQAMQREPKKENKIKQFFKDWF